MHRPPLLRDIVRVPDSTVPEIVTEVTGATLTLSTLDKVSIRTILAPDYRAIRLVGIASARSHGRAREAAAMLTITTQTPPIPAVSQVSGYGSGSYSIDWY